MGRYLMIVLVILLSACAAPEWPRRVSTDEGTPMHVQLAVTQAMSRWNALALEELGYAVFEPGEGDVVVHPYLIDSVSSADIDEPKPVVGWAIGADEVWVSPGQPYLESTLTHELGHILGLHDREDVYTPGSEGLMQHWAPWHEPTFTVRDRYDLREAARVHETAPGYPW